jgi:hypothetical protein
VSSARRRINAPSGTWLAILALTLLSFTSCRPPAAPPPPPVAASKVTAVFTFSVKVLASGPPLWSYSLTSTVPGGTGDFTSVQMHSTCDLSKAKTKVLLEKPGGFATPGPSGTIPNPGFTISQPAPTDILIDSKAAPASGWETLIISVEVDCANGAIDFIFKDAPTGSNIVVGPVAGPH